MNAQHAIPRAPTKSPGNVIPIAHCPECDYDLGGLPLIGLCPECGSAYEPRPSDMPVQYAPPPLHCEDCGCDLDGCAHTDDCPDCGRSVRLSDPERRPGLPSQRNASVGAYVRTLGRLLVLSPDAISDIQCLSNARFLGRTMQLTLVLGVGGVIFSRAGISAFVVALIAIVPFCLFVGVWSVLIEAPRQWLQRPTPEHVLAAVDSHAIVGWIPGAAVFAASGVTGRLDIALVAGLIVGMAWHAVIHHRLVAALRRRNHPDSRPKGGE